MKSNVITIYNNLLQKKRSIVFFDRSNRSLLVLPVVERIHRNFSKNFLPDEAPARVRQMPSAVCSQRSGRHRLNVAPHTPPTNVPAQISGSSRTTTEPSRKWANEPMTIAGSMAQLVVPTASQCCTSVVSEKYVIRIGPAPIPSAPEREKEYGLDSIS